MVSSPEEESLGILGGASESGQVPSFGEMTEQKYIAYGNTEGHLMTMTRKIRKQDE